MYERTICKNSQVVFQVVKRGQVELAQFIWILQCDDILPLKWFIGKQVFEVFGFNIQLIDSFVRVDIACCFYGNQVRVFGEDFVQYGTVVLSLGVLVEVQFDQ